MIQGFSVSGASLDKIHFICGAPGKCPLLRTDNNPENTEQHVEVLVGIFDWIKYSNMTHRRSLDARRGISKPIFKQEALFPWIWLHETALGKGRAVPWIFCLQRAKCCVEMMCKLVPGLWAHGHSDWILSSALGASHCLHPWHMVRHSQGSWRVWSHDLDLSNRCVSSFLATVMGSGLGHWPIGAQGRDSRWNQGEEEFSCCWKGRGRWGQTIAVGGAWGQPGAIGNLPTPVRAEALAWEWGRCWAQGLRALVPAVVPELHLRFEGSHLPVRPPASLWACLNHAGFSVQRAKLRPWKCKCVCFGWLQGRNVGWHRETPI